MVGLHVETVAPEAGGQRKKNAPLPSAKPDVPTKSAGGEPERSDSDDSL